MWNLLDVLEQNTLIDNQSIKIWIILYVKITETFKTILFPVENYISIFVELYIYIYIKTKQIILKMIEELWP